MIGIGQAHPGTILPLRKNVFPNSKPSRPIGLCGFGTLGLPSVERDSQEV
jgi:hypothetical protein